MDYSEGVADGEVEGGVAVPVGRDDRPGLLTHRRIVSLHAEVKAEQEVVEVHAQAETVGAGKLLIELIKLNNPTLLKGSRPPSTFLYHYLSQSRRAQEQ